MRLSGRDALLVPHALLVDDGQRRVQLAGDVARALGVADVGCEHGDLGQVALLEVAAQRVERGQLIDRDVEEALDLAGVQVDGEHAVGAGGLDQVRPAGAR